MKEWLEKNPNVEFHFTPVGSSWLNQIETWFGVITRQAIRRGTFSSVKVLIKRIHDYIAHWNSNAEPFVWTATADEILAKVRLVQAQWPCVYPEGRGRRQWIWILRVTLTTLG